MKRIGITPEQEVFREQERITAWLRSSEVEFFHIRKPQFTETQLREYLSLFPTDVRERLTLHDHHHLAAEFGIGGLHLNRRNPSVAENLADKRISASCHSIGEFEKQQAHCAYCFLSPIFDSVSKQGYTSAFAPDTLKKAFAEGLLNSKAVALGGVTREKIPLLQEIGFSACASIGDLWMLPQTMFITHHNARYDYVDGAIAVLEGGLRFVQLRMKDATHKHYAIMPDTCHIIASDSTKLTDMVNMRRMLYEDFMADLDNGFIRSHRFYHHPNAKGLGEDEVELGFRSKHESDDRGWLVLDTVRYIVLSAQRSTGTKTNRQERIDGIMYGNSATA